MSEPASPPRRSIDDLPTEIKQRIVELCAEQDAVYREWTSEVEAIPGLDGGYLRQLKENKKTYGRLTRALFCTSRSWSALAAPFVFRVLRASRADPIWQYEIASSRARFFTHVHLDGNSPSKLADVCSRMASFTHLQDLTITRDARSALLSDTLDPYIGSFSAPPARRYALKALRAAVSRVRVLHAVDLRPIDLHNLAGMSGSSLRKVEVVFGKADQLQEGAELDLFPLALTKLANLQKLSIVTDKKSKRLPNFSAWVDQFAVHGIPLPLRRLSLSVFVLTETAVAFCELFRDTLTHLAITSTIDDDDWTDELEDHEAPDFSEVFPLLHTLSLNGAPWKLSGTINSMTSDVFPVLQHLNFRLVDATPNAVNAFPYSFLKDHARTLQTLHYPHLGDASPDGVALVLKLCRDNDIRLTLPPVYPLRAALWTPWQSRSMMRSESANEVKAAAADDCDLLVSSSIDFLVKRLADARRTGDKVLLSQLAASVRGIDLEMQAYRS